MLVYEMSGIILFAVAAMLLATGVAPSIDGIRYQHPLSRFNGLSLATIGVAHIIFVMWG